MWSVDAVFVENGRFKGHELCDEWGNCYTFDRKKAYNIIEIPFECSVKEKEIFKANYPFYWDELTMIEKHGDLKARYDEYKTKYGKYEKVTESFFC